MKTYSFFILAASILIAQSVSASNTSQSAVDDEIMRELEPARTFKPWPPHGYTITDMENPQIVARLNEQSRLEYEQKERSYTRYLMAIKDRPDVAQDLDLSISLATLQKPNSLLQGMEAKSAGVVRKFLEDVNKDLDFSQESLLSRVSIPQLPKIELEPLKFEKYLEKDKADKQEPSNQ